MFIGKLAQPLMEALLERLPVEFSVTDADDRVVAWNRHETRLFRRAQGVLGKDVRNCHPKSSVDKVERILSEMKAGARDTAEFWLDMEVDGKPEKVLIQYFALRDTTAKFLGCLECSQKVGHIKSLTGQKRLLD